MFVGNRLLGSAVGEERSLKFSLLDKTTKHVNLQKSLNVQKALLKNVYKSVRNAVQQKISFKAWTTLYISLLLEEFSASELIPVSIKTKQLIKKTAACSFFLREREFLNLTEDCRNKIFTSIKISIHKVRIKTSQIPTSNRDTLQLLIRNK